MIRGEHLHKEINEMKAVSDELLAKTEGKSFEGNVLKGITLILKMLLNIRQNQVAGLPPEKLAKQKDNE